MIRIMKASDYDEVYKLWLDTKGMGLNNLDDSREGIERFLKRNPNTCFVAEEDSKIVGAIIAGNDGRRGYIYHTSVTEDFRRRGIAKALVENVITAMQAEGINKCALLVFERNEIGNAFWEKIGFEKREDIVYRNKAIADIIRIDT